MSDPASPSTPTDAPPLEDDWRSILRALRARLDELDDQIHDLLMVRAGVIESVAQSGKPAAFRPGREAAILRRLLDRHTGKLPPSTLVRMWRELLAGTTAMQTAIAVAVFDPTHDGTLTALAREHFGFLTPTIAQPSVDAALQCVRAGTAAVAVLPFPTATAAWWPQLTAAGKRLYVIARLPFWAARPDGVPSGDALVVGTAEPDASGIDRSFIAAADRAGLTDAGLTPLASHGTIIEVDGMIAADDKLLPAGAIALGGYAVPVAGGPA